MQFRVRSSSKKNSNNDSSILEFATAKSLLHTESSSNRTLAARIDNLEAALSSFQDQYRREKELNNTSSLEWQKKLDRLEYKAFSAEQDLRQLNEIKEIKPTRDIFAISASSEPSKNEILFLKQVIMQEKQAQKQNLKHQNALIQQLTMKQLRAEQELRELLTNQRMEYESRMSGQGEQIREIQGLKQRKIDQQYQMIKGLISSSERRVYEQLERKLKSELVVKEIIEERLNALKEELSSEQQQTIATEAKFIRETKQSLESLFALINNVKKQLGDELAETQKLSVKSLQRLSMTLDIARSKSTDELKQLSASQQQMNNELVEIRNFVTNKLEENRQIMSQFEEQTLQKLDNSGQFSKASPEKRGNDGESFSHLQKELNQWKSITEQKNLNVFKEISNTLKTMKLEWRKENDELVSEVAAINESLKNVKKSAPNQLKKSVQAIITIFNNEFDVLAEELQAMTEMISVAKKETQKSFKEQLNRMGTQMTENTKTMIASKAKEINLYHQKALARSEQSMRGYVSKQVKYSSQLINQRLEKLQGEMTQLELTYKKSNVLTTTQLEEYSMKLKTFNENYKEYLEEQRKDDLKKRIELEQLMRKNASSLMDICYKKSQFLVEGLKNNIEIAQMKEKVETAQALDGAKEELKKQIIGSKQDMQKEIQANVEKVTKERQNSEEILHQAIEQSIITAKMNLTNDIASAKNEMDGKLNEVKARQAERQIEQQKDMIQLKNTFLSMIREEKRLNEESLIKNKKQVDDKFLLLERNQQAKQLERNAKDANARKEIEVLIHTVQTKQQALLKDELAKSNLVFDNKLTQQSKESNLIFDNKLAQQSKEIKDHMAKMEESIKLQQSSHVKQDQQTKSREAQLQKKIGNLVHEVDLKNKTVSDKIEDNSKRIGQLKTFVDQNYIKSGQESAKSATTLKTELQSKQKDLTDKIEESRKANEILKAKDAQIQAKLVKLSQQIQLKNKASIDKIDEANKANDLLKAKQQELQSKLVKLSQELDLKNKASNDKLDQSNKANQSLKVKQAQMQSKITKLSQQVDTKIKASNDKIEETNKKISQLKLNNEKQAAKNGEDKTKSLQSLKGEFEKKNKDLNQKLQAISKKLAQEEKAKAQKDGSKKNETTVKASQIQKKIADLATDVDTKNKVMSQNIQQLTKKVTDLSTNNDKQKQKEGQGKKVGEQSLNQLRADLQKQIKQLSSHVDQLQAKDNHQQQEEAINSVRKSVNKLEAMVFSEQAKNKAMFDRMSEDINKVSQHLSMIANEMRE